MDEKVDEGVVKIAKAQKPADPMRRHGFMDRVKGRPARSEKKDTKGGALIRSLMEAGNKKGNPKNFVVLIGERLIDWTGVIEIIGNDEGFEPSPGMRLVHKRDLHKYIGARQAALFWNKRAGVRVSTKGIPRLPADEVSRARKQLKAREEQGDGGDAD